MFLQYNFFQHCDGTVFSCEAHCIKPDLDIYHFFLEKYGLKLEKCAFIDDVAENVHAAHQIYQWYRIYGWYISIRIGGVKHHRIVKYVKENSMTQIKMRKFLQNKLWRDKAVDMMEQQHGSIIHWKYLDDDAFKKELNIKLIEEAQEVVVATSHESLIGELADVFEIIDALCKAHNITHAQIISAQQTKREKRGGFDGRKYVTIAEHPDGSFGVEYCLADPEKYPETT